MSHDVHVEVPADVVDLPERVGLLGEQHGHGFKVLLPQKVRGFERAWFAPVNQLRVDQPRVGDPEVAKASPGVAGPERAKKHHRALPIGHEPEFAPHLGRQSRDEQGTWSSR